MPAPLRLAALALASASLAACATAPGAVTPDPVAARPGAIYGLYLNGQAALQDGRSADAARYFDAAAAASPGDAALRERAFVAALLSGDVAKAERLSPSPTGTATANQRLGRLVRAVGALADGRGAAAAAELSGEAVGFPHRAAATLLKPWTQYAAGDVAAATAPGDFGRDRALAAFGETGRALLLERARRPDEAEAVYRELLEQAPNNDLLLLTYGRFLERRGARARAAELYRRGLEDDASDSALIAALSRATARRASPPPLPSLREGAAIALLAPASALAAERQTEAAIAYLRLALHLDPKQDEGWLLLGDQLNEGKDRGGARAAYARVRPTSPDFAIAQARLAFTYEQEGNRAEALRRTEAAAKAAPQDRTVQLAHADMLRSAERHAEAITVFDRLIAAEADPDWRLLYLRGISHEQAGDWPAAERDLQAALKLNPGEAEILNYLGYAWIDRGEHLTEALGMVERAVELKPQSGAIIDSLGWAHYRLGRYPEAVEQLERAVELEPADPTVNDHLGDAYWRVGRRTEARFQWRRALTLQPDAKLKAAAEAKLANGLGATGPAPAPSVATP